MSNQASKERMPYLLSTYRSDDRVVIQCESVEKAEEALARVMEWLHSQVETGASLPIEVELLMVARDCLPDPDFVPTEEQEIKVRSIRNRIDVYLWEHSHPKTSVPICPTCKTELAFPEDVCGLCNPVAQP